MEANADLRVFLMASSGQLHGLQKELIVCKHTWLLPQ